MLTTESTEMGTRLAVFAKPEDVHELADILVEELGLHPTDAMHEAHSVPCVLSPRVTSANSWTSSGFANTAKRVAISVVSIVNMIESSE